MNQLTKYVSQEVLDQIQLGRMSAEKALEKITKELMEVLMINCRYNQSKAAKALGISRGKLRSDLKKYFGDKYVGCR
jgi:DNA-binding protein Fis